MRPFNDKLTEKYKEESSPFSGLSLSSSSPPEGGLVSYMHSYSYFSCPSGKWIVVFRQSPDRAQFKRVFIPCNAWSCPVCCERKKRLVYKLIKKSCPKSDFYMLTLTLRENSDSLAENWKKLSKCWNILCIFIRKRYKNLKYFRVFELHKNGMPHLHALINVQFSNKILKNLWFHITGDSFIARFEKVRHSCAGYVIKYLEKSVNDIDKIRSETGTKTKLFVYSKKLLIREKKKSEWKLWDIFDSIIAVENEFTKIISISRFRWGRAGPVFSICDENNYRGMISFSILSAIENIENIL